MKLHTGHLNFDSCDVKNMMDDVDVLFGFQNRSFEVKALHLYALDFIEYSFIDE